jgi:CubicO group peptidase (beta-lactamase class C family)
MDRLPVLAKSNIIEAGDDVYPMPKSEPLDVGVDVDAYMTAQRTAGLVIVHDGKIRLEKYGLDFSGDGKWTSFSVAKSFTSTLVGAAIKDGYIKSIDDKVSAYIPDLKGSVYDEVSIKQLLTMTSGVKWNEDYGDKNSDVARFNAHKAEDGMDVTISYMRKLPREAPAGTKWVYKTGETNLIGVLVSQATKKTLSRYLSEKIWAPFGMEQDASWLLGATGHESAGAVFRLLPAIMHGWGCSCWAAASLAARLSCPMAGLRQRPPSRPISARSRTAMAINGGPSTMVATRPKAFSGRASVSTPSAG